MRRPPIARGILQTVGTGSEQGARRSGALDLTFTGFAVYYTRHLRTEDV